MFESIVNFVKLTDTAQTPTQGSRQAAGWDLYANLEDKTLLIAPYETVMVPTGIAMALPEGTFGAIFARSGLATKRGLAPANKVGVIDSDYRGELIVALHNHSEETHEINPNDRIAQIVFTPYLKGNFCIVDDLNDTERGTGGFGSTNN